jgi:formate-dependent nitrite reductase membrane component NrfD
MLIAALLWWLGHGGPLVTFAAPVLSIVFITLTAVVLVIDLERPERFYYILTRSNWRSWMVWGAYFLTGHGALSAAWLLAGWFGAAAVLTLLTWPVIIVGILATSYTGFLFAQGLGRDLWQGPSAAIDLIAQSGAAGSAALLLAAIVVGPSAAATIPLLGWLLVGSVTAHVLFLLFEHVLSPSPTKHHELATETITRGHYSRLFWGGAILAGGVLPVILLSAVGATYSLALTSVVALLTLLGGAAWEYIWVEAGQSVPLS